MMPTVKRSKMLCLLDHDKLKKINSESKQLVKAYKRDMTLRELSDKTIDGYISDLNQWLIYVLDNQDNKSVLEIDEDDLTDFFFYCKESGNHTARMKRRYASISAFYKYLRKKRKIVENPMEFIDRPIKETKVVVQTFLTSEEVALMKEKLAECGDMTLELYALLSLSTMARVNAIRNLRWKQIDYENRVFTNVLEKEGKYVTLYFSKECKMKLLALQNFREVNYIDDGGYLFFYKGEKGAVPISAQTLNSWCKKIGKMIGQPTLHPHDFRHSGSQLLKLAGMSIEDISEFLNHESTDTTCKFYLQADKKSLRAAKDRFENYGSDTEE